MSGSKPQHSELRARCILIKSARQQRVVAILLDSERHKICQQKPKSARIHIPILIHIPIHILIQPLCWHPQGITLVYARLARWLPQGFMAALPPSSWHPISGACVNTLCSLQLLNWRHSAGNSRHKVANSRCNFCRYKLLVLPLPHTTPLTTVPRRRPERMQ